MTHHTHLKAALLNAALAVPSYALAQVAVGSVAGSTEAEITAVLQEAGYTVLEVETEEGMIEADVVLDGIAHELEIDPATGVIAEIELEDDDDEEDESEEDDGEDDA